MFSESRDLFKFWEISDNISETVHDTDSCNGKLIGNRRWPIEWHHCMTLKVTFAVLKPF